MTDEELDATLVALSAAGFGLPFGAKARDYDDLAALAAADAEAWAANRDALRNVLAALMNGGTQ